MKDVISKTYGNPCTREELSSCQCIGTKKYPSMRKNFHSLHMLGYIFTKNLHVCHTHNVGKDTCSCYFGTRTIALDEHGVVVVTLCGE